MEDITSILFQICRDVTAGLTVETAVAPKFSDALTLFQLGGEDSAPTLQRSHKKFPHDYISVISLSLSINNTYLQWYHHGDISVKRLGKWQGIWLSTIRPELSRKFTQKSKWSTNR